MSRRAIAHQHSLDADDSGDDGQHGEEVDEKLAVRRAKNREAARRVRERRMNQIKTLSEQVAALTMENERLKSLNARSMSQQGQPSTVHDGAIGAALSDHSHSANHTATPTQSQTQHRQSVDRDDHNHHKDNGEPSTPSDTSRTSDAAGSIEMGVQTDVTMAAQDWSPRDIMQVMTLLTRSSMPDGLAGLQQQPDAPQQQQPAAAQAQRQLQQLQQQQQQPSHLQEQQQKVQKPKQPTAAQQPRPQAVLQQQAGLSPAASPATTVSTGSGTHNQDQGQQTAPLPLANAPFTYEQVQALLELNSKLLVGQQHASPSSMPTVPGVPLPAPALQQQQQLAQQQPQLQQQQHKRPAPSGPSPSSATGVASSSTQSRAQQPALKQEPQQPAPRQATWQDLRLLRSGDPAASISMVPWAQAASAPMGPSAVAAAQAAAALATQGRSGSGGLVAARSGSGPSENGTYAPQLQNLYNSTAPADMRAFNRSAGLLFSLDDNEATLMSTDGNLLSDMNLGLTSDMNLASEELLRHVPLPEDAAALGHTAWL